MKTNLVIIFIFLTTAIQSYAENLIITGIYDGPLSGGTPKGIEIYSTAYISDLSLYSLGCANNGGGSDGIEFTFPEMSLNAGSFIYVSYESESFASFFGFEPTFTDNFVYINGDDAIELFYQETVIDVFGNINVDGTGEVWEYTDSWAYSNNTRQGNDTFNSDDWYYGGIDVFDGFSTNEEVGENAFPVGSYSTVPEAKHYSLSLSIITILLFVIKKRKTSFHNQHDQ